MDQGAHANVSHLKRRRAHRNACRCAASFPERWRTVEQLPLDVLTGPCYVIQLPDGVEAITAEALDGTSLPEGTNRILFGTSNSRFWSRGESEFQENFVAVTEDGADGW
jgi:kynurenine formamidase